MMKDLIVACITAYTPFRLSTIAHLILLWSSMLLVCQELAIAGFIAVSHPDSHIVMATQGALLVVLSSHLIKWLLLRGPRGSRH
jgi:hypothetical protein